MRSSRWRRPSASLSRSHRGRAAPRRALHARRRFRSSGPGTAATTPASGASVRDVAAVRQPEPLARSTGATAGLRSTSSCSASSTRCGCSTRPRTRARERRAAGHDPGHRQLLHLARHPGDAVHRRDHLHRRLGRGARRRTRTLLGQRAAARGQPVRGRHRDRLRAEHQPEPRRAAELHQRLPGDASLRCARARTRRPADHRHGRGRPMADRHQPQGDRRLAVAPTTRCWTTPTRWCPPASRRPQRCPGQLAGARRRQAAVQPAGAAAGAGEVHGRPLRRGGQQGPARVRRRRQLAAAGDSAVRAVRRPNGAGTTPGMLGFMFWAAERPSTRGVGTRRRTRARRGSAPGQRGFGFPFRCSPFGKRRGSLRHRGDGRGRATACGATTSALGAAPRVARCIRRGWPPLRDTRPRVDGRGARRAPHRRTPRPRR